ncbi:hypothetical protein [Streptomyces sp. CAU 1734]|uniref:hypothetical protein n=1 Tax=Streptomyces sp. CAU 1734 TaxID=3140360 RepID=UPI0032619C22
MSFGDPNNPYGHPQQQGGQPGQGWPQGGPEGTQPPGYGYPQAPPLQPYGVGAPVMTEMPPAVRTARTLLWVIVSLQGIGALLLIGFGLVVNVIMSDEQLKNDYQAQDLGAVTSGSAYGFGVFALVWGAIALVLAIKFKSGGQGVRIATMIYAILTAIAGIYPFILVGLIHTVLAIIVAVQVGKAEGSDWFARPRH